ncbi:response regulator [Paenibacillus sp. HB172176]|uniref:response regulator n=1 Tax=Paenibacillus sp. HB172176 TaxID=2493690 RepID=UPI00143A21F2|nr:response regulator [Paenibacillus sp. HB172176]
MNWKIAFIDDEPLVRNHLRSILEWEKEGFVLCGEAGDGHEALELVESQRPDAVIVDMSMPGMTGLELIRQLLAANPLLRVIVLSSYDSFEYVRGSLSHGAVDYLLKHRLSPDTLGAVIGHIRKQLQESEARKQATELADMALARTVLHDHFMGVDSDLHPLESYFSKSGLSREQSSFVLMVIQLAHYDVLAARMQEQELIPYLKSITDLCDQAVGGYPWSCTVALDRGRWAMLIVSGKERSEHAAAQRVAAKGSRLESSLKLYMNLAAKLLISPSFSMLEQSNEVYRRLIQQLERQESRFVHDGHSSEAPFVTIGHEKRLLAAMEAADAEEAIAVIQDIMGAGKQGQAKTMPLERVSAELVQIAAKIARKANLSAAWMVQELSIFQRPGLTSAQARSAVCCIYTKLAEELQSRHFSSGYSRHVRQALQIIAGRYREGVTLEETADGLGITPSYLSRLVKEETGRTFTGLLTEQRIERGKQLLLEGDTPLKELHAKLGFSSNSYFIRVFKEATGETPYAYMQRIQGRSH